MENKELRTYSTSIEVRMEGDQDEVKQVRGHAAVYDELSENLGGFREKIAPGAFDEVLQNDVRALFNHNADLILGRTTSGTLKLSVDDRGLAYTIDVPDTSAGRDLLVSTQRGDINQSSFGFIVEEDTWDEAEDGVAIRTIKKFKRLLDVSPVTFPAYPQTSVAQRSLETWKGEAEERKEPHTLSKKQLINQKINLQNQKIKLNDVI